jgi:kynurenine formamidase
MRIKTLIVGYALALALFLFAQRHPDAASPSEFHEVVDLTHSFENQAPDPVVVRNATYRLQTVAKLERESLHSNSLLEQFGTRLEAPSGFAAGLWTVDQIPAERLVAPLAVVDVTANTLGQPDYQISIEDIVAWERVHEQIPLGAVVIARTGWDSRWASAADYRNADSKGVMHFPGYSEDAVKFLVQGRNALGLGIDTMRLDHGSSKDFPIRQFALAHSVYELDNVTNLDRAPVAGGMIVVAPAKMQNRSISPVRILALSH